MVYISILEISILDKIVLCPGFLLLLLTLI